MTTLGIRCTNKGFTYAVISGTQAKPKIKTTNTIQLPKNFSRWKQLYWLLQEIDAIILKHNINKVVIKRHEGRTKGKLYEERLELESTFLISIGKRP